MSKRHWKDTTMLENGYYDAHGNFHPEENDYGFQVENGRIITLEQALRTTGPWGEYRQAQAAWLERVKSELLQAGIELPPDMPE